MGPEDRPADDDQHAACAWEIHRLEAEVERLQQQITIRQRVIERLPLCPDHRDKVRDTCCWCEVERLRAALRDVVAGNWSVTGVQEILGDLNEKQAAADAAGKAGE